MNTTPRPQLFLFFLSLAGCGQDFNLPPQAASSKYIIYHTDVDASEICMTDLLDREDRYIEHAAAVLGVAPPKNPIDFVWDPIKDSSDPWICPNGDATACYQDREEDELSVVVSNILSNHHELVHAVDVQALGQGGHPTLGEGLAEYLGSLNLSLPREDFSTLFIDMLANDPKPNQYRLAMHFVGSIFEKHGSTKYRELRTKMPGDAGPDKFAEVFESVYGQTLNDALGEMNGTQIFGVDLFPGCDNDASVLPWTSDGTIDTVLESSCGDPWFYGGGVTEGVPEFYKYYAVNVSQAGLYELTVDFAEGSPAFLSGMAGCSFDLRESMVASRNGQPGQGDLQIGKHFLVVAIPSLDDAKGGVIVRLDYISP